MSEKGPENKEAPNKTDLHPQGRPDPVKALGSLAINAPDKKK